MTSGPCLPAGRSRTGAEPGRTAPARRRRAARGPLQVWAADALCRTGSARLPPDRPASRPAAAMAAAATDLTQSLR